MTAMTSAGTTLGISAGTPATFDEAGFEALSFTAIGEITDIGGEVGRVYNLVTHTPLATRATQKFKGAYNSGNLQLTLAMDEADAGQILAEAALTSDADYSFVLTFQDLKKLYFRGKVMSFPRNVAGVDAITARTMNIEITANATGQDYVEAAS